MKQSPAAILNIALVVFFAATLPLRANAPKTTELVVKLDELRETIVAEVTTALRSTAPKTS